MTGVLPGWRPRAKSRLDDAGATAVEYALLLVFIAAVIIAAVRILGQSLIPGFTSVSSQL